MKNQNPKVRNRFDRVRRTVILADAPEKSLTQQQFKDECDMNRIVRNAMRGIAPRFMAHGQPHYGDFGSVPDLTEAYNITARAEEAFMTLPAELRAELNNDPTQIGTLTAAQIKKYKLGKGTPTDEVPTPLPASSERDSAPDPAPKKSKKVNED